MSFFDNIGDLCEMNVEQHNAFMTDTSEAIKYLTAIMTTTIKTRGDDDSKLRPSPASWTPWDFEIRTLLAPYPRIVSHLADSSNIRHPVGDLTAPIINRIRLRQTAIDKERQLLKSLLTMRVHPIMALSSVQSETPTVTDLYVYLKSKCSKTDLAFVDMLKTRLRNLELPRNEVNVGKHMAQIQALITQLAQANASIPEREQLDHLHRSMQAQDGDENGVNGLWTHIIQTQRNQIDLTLSAAITQFETQALRYQQRRAKANAEQSAFTAGKAKQQNDTTVCEFCGRTGHIVQECRTMRRYADKYRSEQERTKQRKGKSGNKNNRDKKKDKDKNKSIDNADAHMATFPADLMEEIYMADTHTPITEYMLDSGASMSCTGQRNVFVTYRDAKIPISTYGKHGANVVATGHGNIVVEGSNSNGHRYTITIEALYVPNAKANLLSVSQLCAKGMNVTFLSSGQCIVRNLQGVELLRA